ncbi:hypothetical protein J5N97_004531 [Dioscorea zingiberensis]|uniref:Uncharacterized protein n=1 Tax=Dioscorea zingiberensis TaxID=325984 RepID=A0A9D5HR18_9LILI|nr:hypothetical protein J5N97_004531 [Dioscorea zingiberensis]
MVRELSGANWNDDLKKIVLDTMVYKVFVDAHPTVEAFKNKPFDNYEDLKIIYGDDHATAAYAKSNFDNLWERVDLEDNINVDNDWEARPVAGNTNRPNENTTQPFSINIPSSTSVRLVHKKKRVRESNPSVIGQLVDVVEKVANVIKNPTHWSEILYERVMELDRFPDGLLEDACVQQSASQ